MHTILGAGGSIATALTNVLTENEQTVRLISRRPVATNSPLVSWQQGDLLDAQRVTEVTKGAEIIYLCAGLKYDAKVWQEQWPIIMDNVIAAARAHDARLLFFDNIYMYGLVDGPITEETAYCPVSEKGKVRAEIADTLMAEVGAGRLRAGIARAPDFYGITGDNSFLDSMVLHKFAKGERAMWVGKTDKLHNFIYVPDAARAMYILAQHPESDNQVWHLPTPVPITGDAMLALAAEAYGVPNKHFTINKFLLRTVGLFDPVVQGTVEMYYQYDHDYRFNSDKFEQKFGVQPTPYRDALQELARQAGR